MKHRSTGVKKIEETTRKTSLASGF